MSAAMPEPVTVWLPHSYNRDEEHAKAHSHAPYRCTCGRSRVDRVHPHEPIRGAARGATDCVCGMPMNWKGHLS